MNMECWSKEKIASIGSMFFFGNAVGVFSIFLPDKIGRMATLKYFVLPTTFFGFNLVLFTTDYYFKCLAYFIIGLC
jgi:hypothetical protein